MYLTYDTSYMPDGFGAQYSRIVGIHCLAQCHGATYVHSVIKEYEHLPDDYWKRIDDHFGLSTPKNPTLPLLPLKEVAIAKPQSVAEFPQDALVKIGIPHDITDQDIDRYFNDDTMGKLRKLKRTLPLAEYEGCEKTIAIHIRRGDVSKEVYPERYTDNAKLWK